MRDSEAARWSKQLVDNGYVNWLEEKLRQKAFEQFQATSEADLEALRRAKSFDLVSAVVREILYDSAQVAGDN